MGPRREPKLVHRNSTLAAAMPTERRNLDFALTFPRPRNIVTILYAHQRLRKLPP